ERPGPGDALLQRRAGARLRRRRRLRHRGPRPLLPGAAGARHLPAAVAVRGLVRLPRPQRSERRPHPRRHRRGPRRAVPYDAMTEKGNGPTPEQPLAALAEQLRAEDTPIAPHVVAPSAAPELGLIAAAGPRAAAAPGEYAQVIEAV